VNQEYFAQLSQVIPLLLVAVGVEARLFERLRGEPIARAITYFTVGILCLSEAFVLSALVRSNSSCGDVLTPWHEYIAFVLSAYASATALMLLVTGLVTDPGNRRSSNAAQRRRRRRRREGMPTPAGRHGGC
jgi:hypothetical protein